MEDCAVCLEAIDLALPDYTRMALLCKHWFHTACIAQWLIQSHSCPQCRRVIHAAAQEQPGAVSRLPRHTIEHYEAVCSLDHAAWYFHMVCQCVRLTFPRWLNDAYWYGALDVNTAFRLFLNWRTLYELVSDTRAYDAELANTAVSRYSAVLKCGFVLRLISLLGHTLFDWCSRGCTSTARHALVAVVPVDFVLHSLLLCATSLAQDDFKRHVSVEVTFTNLH